MNIFLNELFEKIAIDIEHLHQYLSSEEINYLDSNIKSKFDFDSDFYTNKYGENLEVLLHFLNCHKEEIKTILNSVQKNNEILIDLYKSPCISGNYDCFRFDLSKIDKVYESKNNLLQLYRVGRDGEGSDNLGNSWTESLEGLDSYCSASSIDKSNRPVFRIEINDSEVLFRGNEQERELVLKPGFKFIKFELLNK